MKKSNIDCIDVGSENCPCYLAVTGDCIICSRLQGKEECDCEWKGVCIYNEFLQGNRRINNPRKDFYAKIVNKIHYLEDLVVFTIDVGKGFALKASIPGSYIFLKDKGSSSYYDTPLCVMKTDVEKGHISIAIKVISAKTKKLLKAEEGLLVRGIYRSGILGMSKIVSKDVIDKKVLLVTKGTGIASAILTADYLWRRNRVDCVIDKEKISVEMISDYMGEGDGIIKYISLSDKDEKKELSDLIIKEQYDIVVLLMSDYFIKEIGTMIKGLPVNVQLAFSNNFNICCGEGICGACAMVDNNGDTIKMCKCRKNDILI